ncbi:hypothetical protein [Peribacillus kribbensis]|uniref:hypothetical protein n=1 Tax=Peribacillus kribbensis TaxID=356658 RepID=UPI0004008830|nr:hypothetical protein [Peribacillus kribbensis]
MEYLFRYLFKWGFPGWVYVLIVSSYFIIEDKSVFIAFFHGLSPSVSGTFLILFSAGLVIGYIIHQISLLLGHVIWTKWQTAYHNEFNVESMIMAHPGGKEILDIYTGRMSEVAAARSLTGSAVLSSLTLIILFYLNSWSTGTLLLFIGNAILVLIVFINYRYLTKNLHYFIFHLNKEMLWQGA